MLIATIWGKLSVNQDEITQDGLYDLNELIKLKPVETTRTENI